ncbi:MAG: peptidylprolyl isomerase, partial [Paraclostridium sp.]
MLIKKLKCITVASLVAVSMVGCSNSVKDDEVVATVNGKDITVGYYKTTLALQKQAIESMYGPDIWEQEFEKGTKFKDKFKEDVLGQITDIYSIYDEAEKEKLLGSKEEIDKSFDEMKKVISEDKEYEKNLEKIGVNDEYIRNQQAQDIAIKNYKADFEKKTKISDEDAKSYYDKNKDEFYVDEVQASHILISTNDENDKPLSEAKKKEAKKKAEQILKQVKDGGDFEKLAKENSDCPSSEKGGDLGYFGKGEMVPEFDEVAFKLKEGEISDIVETQFGYHIIKLVD